MPLNLQPAPGLASKLFRGRADAELKLVDGPWAWWRTLIRDIVSSAAS